MDDFEKLESSLFAGIPCKRPLCNNKFDLTRNNKEYCSEKCRKDDERERYYLKRKNYLQLNMRVKNKFTELPLFNKVELSADLTKIVSGIYFLLLQDEIVYIGMSNHIVYRIACHSREYVACFDRILYFPMEKGANGIHELENRLIEKYEPRYNVNGWPDRMETVEEIVKRTMKPPRGDK